MRILFLILFLFFPFFVQAQVGYETVDGTVYYDDVMLESANLESFVVLDQTRASDKNFCYYQVNKLANCQPKNFSILKGKYSKDDNFVYYEVDKITGADAKTFATLDEVYAKDRSLVYLEGKIIVGAASDSFVLSEPGYARDASNLYKGSEIILGIDPESFTVINNEYYKDKDGVYFQGEAVENAHPGSFRMMANEYARDANYFYRYGKAVAKSSNTFYERFRENDLSDTCPAQIREDFAVADLEAIEYGFAVDGECVYFQAQMLEHSHAGTFEIINAKIAKDKNFVYVLNEERVETIPFASSLTFQDLGGGYYRDKYVIYYGENLEILNGADIDSFKVVCQNDNCTYEAEDKNRFYLNGLEVGLDEATQQIIGESKLVYFSSNDITSLINYNGFDRDLIKEKEVGEKYVKSMVVGVYDLTQRSKETLINFIFYGTQTTRALGAGERAGVVGSYKAAFGKLPQTEQDWTDVIKIANGRWPTERNEIAEERADRRFRYIYHRAPYSFDQHDQAAITVIAYGLRTPARNMESEKVAILTFRKMFIDYPSSAGDWDMVRAIAYSGASR